MEHPLDRASMELAFSLAPKDCDGFLLGRAIAVLSLAASALIARLTDEMEPVAQGLTAEEITQAATDVSACLDIAHRYSMEAGPRD